MMYNTEKTVVTGGPLTSSSNFPWEKKRCDLEPSNTVQLQKIIGKKLGSKCH